MQNPAQRPRSSGLTAAPHEAWQRRDDGLTRDVESTAEIVPEGDLEFAAGLGKAEEGIPAIAPVIAARPGTDLTTDHLTTDVIFRAVGVEWYLRPVQHHQQLGLVGPQPRQKAVQRDEAGTAAEDAIEPRAAPDGDFCWDWSYRP